MNLDVPRGWESRIRRARPPEPGSAAYPVLHAATVPLAGSRADYGAGVVERLGFEDVFISLIEFGDEAIGSKLFPEVDELPRVHPRMFHSNQLQRRIRGQGGLQIFFTYRGRAFCLYVVLGSNANRIELADRVNELLGGLSVDPP